MTAIIVNILNWLSGCITGFIPAIEVGDGALSKSIDAVAYIADMVSQMNWIFPVPDAFLILGLLCGVRLVKLGVFVVNWIIRRIFDVIP